MDVDLKREVNSCRRRRILNLIPERNGFGAAEETALELRLGPPGEHWTEAKEQRQKKHSVASVISRNCFSSVSGGSMGGFFGTVDSKAEGFHEKQQQQPRFHHLQRKTEPGKEQCATASASSAGDHNRIASTPLVGWPPVRSFRKYIPSSSKATLESQRESSKREGMAESSSKSFFVKINMDGIPIGRKIDLRAYDSYNKLCFAVDELFRDLLAAQVDPLPATQKNAERSKTISGLVDGSVEYTLVYEDEEGDKMLVGDVPWEMFVTTAKRLRVMKISELSISSLGTFSSNGTTT